MSSFNASINSQAFNIATENELAVALSHYDSNFVFTVVDNAMKKRFNGVPVTTISNVVAAWEQNFKTIISIYGESNAPEVYRVRNETYKEIIDTICKEFGLFFTIDDNVDLYTAAYCLYDFFVCNFATNMITFFGNYIYRERDSLYETLDQVEFKKNKDSSAAYARRVFKDNKIATINASIDKVITQVCSIDFPFGAIITSVYGSSSEFAQYLLSIVSADSEFFDLTYRSIIASDIRPEIITGIRFKLQELCMANNSIDISNIPGNPPNEDPVEE